MVKNDIIDAYLRIRKIDNTIPDDVLDFMKDCAIEMLDKIEQSNKRPCDCYSWPSISGGFGKPSYCSNCGEDL